MIYLREETRPGGPQRFHGFRDLNDAWGAMKRSIRRFTEEGWTIARGGPDYEFADLQGKIGGTHRTIQFELMTPGQVRYHFGVNVPDKWGGGSGYRTYTGGR